MYLLFSYIQMRYISITHGSQHESVANEETIKTKIWDVIQWWKTIFDEEYNIKNRKWEPVEWRLVVISSEEKPIDYLAFIVKDDPNENFTFNSLYPYVVEWEWTKIEVEILDILEDESYTFEWIIECDFDGKHFYFYDPFYYKNKDKYEIGKTCTVEISGLIYKAWWLTEDEAKVKVDWSLEQRETVWMKPEYDEDWNLKPVIFDATQMNSFIPSHDYPWDFEFQCKMTDLWTFEFNWETLWKIWLEIVREDWDNVSFVAYTREANITYKETFWDWMALRGIMMLQWILCE